MAPVRAEGETRLRIEGGDVIVVDVGARLKAAGARRFRVASRACAYARPSTDVVLCTYVCDESLEKKEENKQRA